MGRPQVADGGNGLQIWRVAADILNKQSRTVDKEWSSTLGVEHGTNNSSQQKKITEDQKKWTDFFNERPKRRKMNIVIYIVSKMYRLSLWCSGQNF
jgi:hypothetical protein